MSDVQDRPDRHRFELEDGGDVAFAAYELHGDTITFTHTIVPEALEGHGVGSGLIGGALAQARERGLSVRPQCSFVRHYIETHPEWQDLLAH